MLYAINRMTPSTSRGIAACIWHINKNLAAHCKNFFETDEDWNSFIREWNIQIKIGLASKFLQDLEVFRRKMLQVSPSTLEYLSVDSF